MKLFCLVTALCAVTMFEANCLSIESIKEATKTIAEKAADKAGQVEPAEEKGGVRATIMHTGLNMALDKGIEAVGKRYPALALGMPIAQKLAKPLVAAAHNTINNWSEGRKNKTEEAVTEQPAAEPTTVAEKPAKEEEKAATPAAEATTTPKPEAVQKKAHKKGPKKGPKKDPRKNEQKADKKESDDSGDAVEEVKEERAAEAAKDENKTDHQDDDKTPEKGEVKEVAEKVDEKTEKNVEDSSVNEKDEKKKKKERKEKSEKEAQAEEEEKE